MGEQIEWTTYSGITISIEDTPKLASVVFEISFPPGRVVTDARTRRFVGANVVKFEVDTRGGTESEGEEMEWEEGGIYAWS